ncbi:MAG: hypothetical protein ACQEWM_13205, partial [Actinomycetota bacterium]
CRRHHMMKHSTGWRVEQLPGGVLEWTSPLGTVFRDEPEPQGPVFTGPPDIWATPETVGAAPAGAAPPGDPPLPF